MAKPPTMHVPASLSGSRQRFALPALRGRWSSFRPSGPLLRGAGGLVVLLVLAGAVLVATPIAHPRTVLVDGVTGPSQERIARLLEEAAAKQSTFAVSDDAIMRAVAAYPEVAGVEIDARPPFEIQVRAIMRPPVARVDVGGRAFVVAGDGTILQRSAEASVPKLQSSAGDVTIRSGRVVGGRAALGVVAAAPEPLLSIARVIRTTSAGIEIEMTRGPRLIFGTAEHAADKWAAAAAIIADGSATGATYIDLRVPARPAVGGLGGGKTASAEPPTLTATQSAGGQAAAPAGAAATTTQTAPAPSAPATPPAPAPAAASPAAASAPSAPVAPAPAAPAASQSSAPAPSDGGGAAIGATP